MKILVCGSRDWSDRSSIVRVLREFPTGTVLIHGGAKGADALAGSVGKALGFVVRAYPAKWHEYGLMAGPIRNREMILKEHRPEEPISMVIAFPKAFSTGTKDMMAVAKLHGIRVVNAAEDDTVRP